MCVHLVEEVRVLVQSAQRSLRWECGLVERMRWTKARRGEWWRAVVDATEGSQEKGSGSGHLGAPRR